MLQGGARLYRSFAIKDKLSEHKKVIVKEGDTITRELAYEIQHSGINNVWVNIKGKKHKLYGNNIDINEKYVLKMF